MALSDGRTLAVPNAGTLHVVEVGGAGPPVVLLHGFTGRGSTMAPAAAGLAGRRQLFVDLPGHGESGAPANASAYTLDATVTDLCHALDALDAPAVDLLGYSLGARIALGFACRRPARIRRLVLVGGRAGLADESERMRRRADDEALAKRIEEEGVVAFVDHWMALPLFASQARLGSAALARARAERLENRAHGLANSLRGIGAGAQPPLFDALPAVAVPTLLVTGDEDERFAVVAEALARRMPDAVHRRVPEAGHAAHLEQPDAFAALVAPFLSGGDAGTTDEQIGPAEALR